MQELDNLDLAGNFNAMCNQRLLINEPILGSSHDEFINRLTTRARDYFDEFDDGSSLQIRPRTAG